MEHDVGGHALLLGRRRTPGPQHLEELDVVVRQVGRRAWLARRASPRARHAFSVSRRSRTSRAPPQDVRAVGVQPQRAVAVGVHPQQLHGQQLPDHAAPLAVGQVLRRHRTSLSAACPSCVIRGRRPCRAGCRRRARRRTAARAAPAGRPSTAASAPATVPSQDSGGVRQVSQLPQRLRTAGRSSRAAAPGGTSTVSQSASIASRCAVSSRAVREVALGRVDHLALLHDVGQAVREPRRGRQAVAAGTAGLLVVALHRLRQVEVGDEPDVGLVDAHPERDGRDHHDARPRAGTAPGCAARTCRSRPAWYGSAGDAVVDQELRGLLDRVPRQAVDDAGVAGVLGAQQVEQLVARLVLGHDAVLDVGPVEAGDEVPWRRRAAAGAAISARVCVGGGGGQRDPGDLGPALVQHRQLQVVGPEVVPPLRHAVRLVDGEQGDRCRGRAARWSARTPQPLGREVQQVELARDGRRPRPARRSDDSCVELRKPARTPSARERVDLVLHQRDQRRDHDARCRPGPAPGSGSTATCRRRSA